MDQNILSTSNQVARSTIAIVDAIAQRGAFKGEELSTIGRLRDQCSALIQMVEQAEAEADAAD